jgi:hypothetical protein
VWGVVVQIHELLTLALEGSDLLVSLSGGQPQYTWNRKVGEPQKKYGRGREEKYPCSCWELI